jgi:HlyD family secretion protein
VLVPVIVLGLLVAWRLSVKKAEQAALLKQRVARTQAAPKVSTAPVELRDITNVFEATGTLESPLTVKISPKVTGRIIFLQVHEGDRVGRGQVLVRIDNTEVEANVRQAQAALSEAQYRLAQAQITQTPTNVQVATQIQTQKAAVASAQADYEQTRENYNAQVAAAQAAVTDAQGRVDNATAAIGSAQAQIGSAQANLNNAKIKYDRVYELYKQGFVAAQDVDDAKAAVAVQQGAVDVAQAQSRSAMAARDSTRAQKDSATQQLSIVKTKGQADIEAARQKLLQARAGLEMALANTAQKPAYQQSLQALKSAVAVNQANLAAARARRADTVLVSPLEGYVTGRFMDPGAVATTGQAILEVRFFGNVWVNVSVPDDVAATVRTGQQIAIRFDSIPDQTYKATVIQLNPSADPQAHQFTVRAAMGNPAGLLKPGMFGHVALTTAQSPHALVVPKEAIQQGDSGPYVIVVGPDQVARFQAVTTGLADANFVSVTQGLSAGEKLVVLTSARIKDGQKVDTGGVGGGQRQGGPGWQPQAPAGQGPKTSGY